MQQSTMEERVRGVVAAQLGATSYFLELDGIDGESLVKGHEKEIEVASYAWGAESSSPAAAGGLRTRGTSFQDLQVISPASKAGPMLMLQCAMGQAIKQAILTGIRGRTDKPQDYFMRVTLENVLISQYSTTAAGDGLPTDSIGSKFDKINAEYRVMSPDGTPGETIRAGFDLKRNTKM